MQMAKISKIEIKQLSSSLFEGAMYDYEMDVRYYAGPAARAERIEFS